MTNHYYIEKPTVEHDEKYIKFSFNKREFKFKTDSGVFSKNKIDFGTSLLIESFNFHNNTKILDIGCGYGPIGITLASLLSCGEVILADINERAINLVKENILLNKKLINSDVKISVMQSDGFTNIKENNFDYILLNPPIRAGKTVIYDLYVGAYRYLKDNGELWVVIQKKQGAPSSIKKLETIYNSVDVVKRNKGYYIIRNVKQLNT